MFITHINTYDLTGNTAEEKNQVSIFDTTFLIKNYIQHHRRKTNTKKIVTRFHHYIKQNQSTKIS